MRSGCGRPGRRDPDGPEAESVSVRLVHGDEHYADMPCVRSLSVFGLVNWLPAAGTEQGHVLVEKYQGCRVFSGRWDEFLRQWNAAPQANRVVLPDKRPAVRRPPDEGEDKPSYVTVHPLVWEDIRPRLEQRMALRVHPRRARLCQACGAEMRVSKEYEQVWAMVCTVCKSVEAWGKDIVGGTPGAGEKEKS